MKPVIHGRWRSLFAFAFATVVDGSEGGLVNGLFPTIRSVLGLSLVDLSVLTNLNKVINAVFGPLWSMAADRHNRKRILVFVTGLWGFWTIAIGFSQNFTKLLVLYFIASLGSVASAPIIMSAVSDLFPDHERGRAMGVFGALSVILAALMVPTFSHFASINLWRYAYYVIGGFSVLSGLLIWGSFQDPGRGATEGEGESAYTARSITVADFRRLTGIPTLVFLFLQKFLNAGQLIWAFGTVFMVDIYGYDNSQAIVMVSIPLFLGSVVGNIASGLLGDRIHQEYPRFGRVAVMQIALFCSAGMSYLSTQVAWKDDVAFYAAFFFWGIFLNFGTGLDRPMVAQVTPPELRATAFGVWMSTGDALASLIWVSLAGWLGDLYGLKVVFLWCMTCVMFLRSFVWFLAYRTYPQDIARMHHLLNHLSEESR